jgi:Sec-independent protein secretion pathway component TatC
MCFAYFIVFPLVLTFFTTIAPDGVEISTDISSFLNFVIKMFFAFGLAFEVPILTVLVIKFGLSTYESLSKKRPYIVVAAFVIGMFLTPPDVISQVLLAIPIWILFELGLFMSKFITKPKSNKKDQASKRFDKLDNDDLDSDEY